MPAFRAGRVFFGSDSAHQLSPFGGGRGGNSGVQDIDNLIWKLALVLENKASETLLDSYDWERIPVADENIQLSNASAEFITPTSATSKALQQAVLNLAPKAEFARSFINTGRMSVTATLRNSPLVTKDQDKFVTGQEVEYEFVGGQFPKVKPVYQKPQSFGGGFKDSRVHWG